MGARDLLATLAHAGITIRLDGANLIVSPRELLTDELRVTLKTNKAALIAELQGGAGVPAGPLPALTPSNSRELQEGAQTCAGPLPADDVAAPGTTGPAVDQQHDARPEPPDEWAGPDAHHEEPEPRPERPAIWRKLIALGLDEEHADSLTAWMKARDIEGDDRRLCVECRYFAQRGKTCRHHHLIEIGAPRDLGALATTPQRCDGFTHGGGGHAD